MKFLNFILKVFASFFSKKEEKHIEEVPLNENLGSPISGKLRVQIGNLRIRTNPNLTGKILGFAEKNKVYNFSDMQEADGYKWYEIETDKWIADDNEGSITLNYEKEAFHYPIQYIAITEYFSGAHLGTDFGWNSDRGYPPDQPIYAAFSGTVVKVWNFNDAGLTIRVRFDDEAADLTWYAQYKHLSATFVKEGDVVKRDDKIALMGGSGGYAPHLHFDLVRCPLGHDYQQESAWARNEYSQAATEFCYAVSGWNVLSYDNDCTKGVKWE